MSIKTLFMAAAMSAFAATSAMAVTLTEQYDATSAVGSGSNHSVWIAPGISKYHNIGSRFSFNPAGLFSLYSDGTATLTGMAESHDKAGSGFKVSFNYDSTFLQTPTFKSENGSKEVLGETFFRDVEGGTLMGYGILAGLNLAISRLPTDGKYAAQIGPSDGDNIGANNKNKEFGMAHWFKISVLNNDCKICSYWTKKKLHGAQGDVNVNLEGGPVGGQVPLPASGLLLFGGLAGLAGLCRKRRAA